MSELLVIGYGNELRRDDGVGPHLARLAAGWQRPNIRALAVHQLTPELADELITAQRVVFVDAGPDAEVRLQRLTPTSKFLVRGHLGDARELLALTAALHGRCPESWLISVPATDLTFGYGLSQSTEHHLARALEQIAALADARLSSNEGMWCTS
jgi:hydrogenase maturation protease